MRTSHTQNQIRSVDHLGRQTGTASIDLDPPPSQRRSRLLGDWHPILSVNPRRRHEQIRLDAVDGAGE